MKRSAVLPALICLFTLTLLRLAVPAAAQSPARPVNGAPEEEIADWQARWELAKVLGYMKKFDESLVEYRKLLAEKPGLVQAKAEMAAILLWSGRKEEAMKLFASLPGGEGDPKTRLAFADAFIADKQYDQARTILLEVLAADPDDLQTRLKLADLLSWTKDYAASITEFRRILKARPADVQVRRKLANVLIWADRKEEAVEELKKTLK